MNYFYSVVKVSRRVHLEAQGHGNGRLSLCEVEKSHSQYPDMGMSGYVFSATFPVGRKLCATCKSLHEKDQREKKKKQGAQSRNAGFYQSWEWKKARFETLKRYGAICMLCGSDKHIVVDHIKPRSRFPDLALSLGNLQILCNSCNMGKSNDDYTDFRPRAGFDDMAEARARLVLITEQPAPELDEDQQSHMNDIWKWGTPST